MNFKIDILPLRSRSQLIGSLLLRLVLGSNTIFRCNPLVDSTPLKRNVRLNHGMAAEWLPTQKFHVDGYPSHQGYINSALVFVLELQPKYVASHSDKVVDMRSTKNGSIHVNTTKIHKFSNFIDNRFASSPELRLNHLFNVLIALGPKLGPKYCA